MSNIIDEVAFTPLSASYPTSSSSLWQHSCVRLLWLPLSACVQMSSSYNKYRSSSLERFEDTTMKSKDNIFNMSASPSASNPSSSTDTIKNKSESVTNSYAQVNERRGNNDNNKNIMTSKNNRLSSSPLSTSTVGNSGNSSYVHTRAASYVEQPVMYNNLNNKQTTTTTTKNNSSNDKGQNDSSSNDSFCRGSVNFAGKSLSTVTSAVNDVTYYSYFDDDFHHNLCNAISENVNEFKSAMRSNTSIIDVEQLSSDRSQTVLQLRQEMSELCHVPMRELISAFQSFEHVSSIWNNPTSATSKSIVVTQITNKNEISSLNSSNNKNTIITTTQNLSNNKEYDSSFITKASTSCPYYNPHATLHVAITDEFGTSQWENIDTHRTVMAVVVVINASLISMPLNEAVDIVLTVFDAHFKDKVCKCVVLHDVKCSLEMSNNNYTNEFLPSLSAVQANKIMWFSAEAPVRQIAAQVMDSVAHCTVMSLCSLLHNYEIILSSTSTTTTSSSTKAGAGAAAQQTEANSVMSLRTPLDKMTNLSSELKRSVLLSRVRKKCGDYLLLLGQHDKALIAYGSTSFGGKVDFFWCSAVVESIAAVRYAQLQVLIRAINEVNNFLINLQSSAAVINHMLIKKLDMLESLLLRHPQQLSDMVLPVLKKASVPVSMKQRLLQEVHEPLKMKVSTFKQFIAQIHELLERFEKRLSDTSQTESRNNKSFAQSTNNNNMSIDVDISSFEFNFNNLHEESREQHAEKQEENEEDRWEISQLTAELKLNVQELIRAAYVEIDIYLKEVKRQLRKVPSNATRRQLRDREWELQLKVLSINAIRISGTDVFLHHLHEACAFARSILPSQSQFARRLLYYFIILSLRANTVRSAIALLVEMAENFRSERANMCALLMLVRACVLTNVQVHISWIDEIASRDLLLKLFAEHGQSSQRSHTTSFATRSEQNNTSQISHRDESYHQQKKQQFHEVGTRSLQYDKVHQSLHTQMQRAFDKGVNKESKEIDFYYGNKTHLLLLLIVMTVMSEIDEFNSVSVELASQLLTYPYYKWIDANTEAMLLRVIVSNLQYVQNCLLACRPHHLPSLCISSEWEQNKEKERELVQVLRIPATPFLVKWEALALPLHLSPRTVSIAGPVFTFIDTHQLKMTILTLNGKRLRSKVVWCVGDAGSVRVCLYNHLHCQFHIEAIALHCTHVLHSSERTTNSPEQENNSSMRLLPVNHINTIQSSEKRLHEQESANVSTESTEETSCKIKACDELALPICYWLHHIELDSFSQTDITLHVKPVVKGWLNVDGVLLALREIPSDRLLFAPFASPLQIPVIERLPHITCLLSTHSIEVFAGQSVSFMITLVNTGKVAVNDIKITAHVEKCQLDDCNGCKERQELQTNILTNVTNVYQTGSAVKEYKHSFVVIHKTVLSSLSSHALCEGNSIRVPVTLYAPSHIERSNSHFIIFRVDCTLPHKPPVAPTQVSSAIPVFAVIPRRVMETKLHISYSPTIELVSISLSTDRRYVLMRLTNLHSRYSVQVKLSELKITNVHDAFVPANHEEDVTPIELVELWSYLSRSSLSSSPETSKMKMMTKQKDATNTKKCNQDALCNCELPLMMESKKMNKQRETFVRGISWIIPELSDCTGKLMIDFTPVMENACVMTELLDECLLSVDFGVPLRDIPDNIPPFTLHWQSSLTTITNTHNTNYCKENKYKEDKNDNYNHHDNTREKEMYREESAMTRNASINDDITHTHAHSSRKSESTSHSDSNIDGSSTISENENKYGDVVRESQISKENELTIASNGIASSGDTTHNDKSSESTFNEEENDAYSTPTNDNVGNNNDEYSALPIILPVMCSVRVHISASAVKWRRSLPLRIEVRLGDAISAGVLSGLVDCVCDVGDNGNAAYEQWFELIVFHAGRHVIEITVSDDTKRVVNHVIPFYSLESGNVSQI